MITKLNSLQNYYTDSRESLISALEESLKWLIQTSFSASFFRVSTRLW
jgi:hypothetical protein